MHVNDDNIPTLSHYINFAITFFRLGKNGKLAEQHGGISPSLTKHPGAVLAPLLFGPHEAKAPASLTGDMLILKAHS